MLANGNLFSYILKGVKLNYWRQIIFALGILIIIRLKDWYSSTSYSNVIRVYFIFAFIIIIYATNALMFKNYSIIRIIYTFWSYFSGVPYLLFPYIFMKYNKCGNAINFYNIFIILGCFSSIGIIIDYCLGGIITQFFFLFNENLEEYSFENIGRYYFLTESPTSFGLFYCFCLICVLFKIHYETKTSHKLLLFIAALLFLFGGWLTGSRQILLAQIIELTISGGFYLLHTKDNKRYLIYICIIGTLILPTVINNIVEQNESLSNRFSSSNMKEDKRSSVWLQGFEDTCLNIDILLLGNAFGYTTINNVSEGEEIGYHYENTYFARISETGLIGLIIFLYPFLIILRKMRRMNFFKSLILGFIISFLTVSFISPNGTHQTSQMVLFIALGMILNEDYYSLKYRDKSSLRV